ncbi:GLUG motif-containing protein [Methanimicrococcus blatticola]|uniref:GLUG motif-containing protein n=1 Tax=Methanimicrococcus blatticola TaxID=91560 RepID=UPI00105EC4E7|nr:GLUG motif-containing protein [Methanimicrococcus blatticola]MBZ3936205.1 hypothetical protein [Methanimicrococcus blatticola]MCC2508448.1 hypothetical protein [Methanimicrococcus blatticola]
MTSSFDTAASCYFNGTLEGKNRYGIGYPITSAENVYFNNKVTEAGFISTYGLTLAELKDPDTYADWDIYDAGKMHPENTWYILEDELPQLLYFYDAGEPIYVNGSNFANIGSYKKIEDAEGREVYWSLNADYVLVENAFVNKGEINDGICFTDGLFPIGADCHPFTGSLTAQNGATIKVEWEYDADTAGPTEEPYPGLFKVAEDAEFNDIHLILNADGTDCGSSGFIVNSKGVEIRNSQITGTKFFADCGSAGGFIGQASGRNVLENSNVNIPVFGSGDIGGFIGMAESDDQTIVFIKNCHYNFTGDVSPKSSVTGCPSGTGSVGGLVGYMSQGVIEDSSVTGSIFGPESVGGLIGMSETSNRFVLINNSSTHGSVTSNDEIAGGLIGYSDAENVHIMNSYVTGDVSGKI